MRTWAHSINSVICRNTTHPSQHLHYNQKTPASYIHTYIHTNLYSANLRHNRLPCTEWLLSLVLIAQVLVMSQAAHGGFYAIQLGPMTYAHITHGTVLSRAFIHRSLKVMLLGRVKVKWFKVTTQRPQCSHVALTIGQTCAPASRTSFIFSCCPCSTRTNLIRNT